MLKSSTGCGERSDCEWRVKKWKKRPKSKENWPSNVTGKVGCLFLLLPPEYNNLRRLNRENEQRLEEARRKFLESQAILRRLIQEKEERSKRVYEELQMQRWLCYKR